jgi:hypothetical protein
MRIEKRELENLLDAVATTDYVRCNKERILSCIEELQSRLSLSGLKTLDLGHDTHVGLLLAKTGFDLVGNIAPIEEICSLAPPTQPSQFQLPNGEICKWQLDPSDPRGLRNSILRTLVSLSLFVSGYFRESALQFKDRGHQIGLLARSI